TQGPAVSAVVDSSDATTEAITVTFSRAGKPTPVDPSTITSLTTPRIVIKDPNGTVLPLRQVLDIAPSSSHGSFHHIYRVLFTGTTSGKYTISIGPNVSDFSGNQMDQNGNNINGENPGDVYSNTVSITPAARPTEGVPFADAFAGNFGDSLGRQWVETNGYFLIQTKPDGAENVAVAQFMGENRAILQLSPTQSNVVVQADVDPSSSTNYTAGLLARFVDGNNYYLGELQSTGSNSYVAKIFKAVSGTLTLLSSGNVATGGGVLRFEVVGNSLKLFLNDTLVTYAEDTDITAAGK